MYGSVWPRTRLVVDGLADASGRSGQQVRTTGGAGCSGVGSPGGVSGPSAGDLGIRCAKGTVHYCRLGPFLDGLAHAEATAREGKAR